MTHMQTYKQCPEAVAAAVPEEAAAMAMGVVVAAAAWEKVVVVMAAEAAPAAAPRCSNAYLGSPQRRNHTPQESHSSPVGSKHHRHHSVPGKRPEWQSIVGSTRHLR